MSGKHIELFLVDGTPGGLTTAEIMNWTGRVLSARRSDIGTLTSRRELAGTCVYLLLGEDETVRFAATSARPTTSSHGYVNTTRTSLSGITSLS